MVLRLELKNLVIMVCLVQLSGSETTTHPRGCTIAHVLTLTGNCIPERD